MTEKEIFLSYLTTVDDLARLIDVPAAKIVAAGFEQLGLLLTINETLSFDQAKELVGRFGYTARRKSG